MMNLFHPEMPQEIVEGIRRVLEDKDGIPYIITQDALTVVHHVVWMSNVEHDTELMIQLDKRGEFRIKRVQVLHQKQGVLNAVFDYILDHRVELGAKKITVEAVTTLAMNKWCIKHGFVPSPHCLQDDKDGCYYGDWYYN